MTEYRAGTKEASGTITLPIKDALYFEIGSYYTSEQKYISTKNNRIRLVSDKRKRTFIDMLCIDIKYKNYVAFVYFENGLILK